MPRRRCPGVRHRGRLAAAAAAALALAVAGGQVLTAASSVPPSLAGRTQAAITANALKPPECGAIALTALVLLAGSGGGGSANELILGANTTGAVITGGAGDDCLITGGSNNDLRGQAGNDVCIGPASTIFRSNCETTVIR